MPHQATVAVEHLLQLAVRQDHAEAVGISVELPAARHVDVAAVV